MEIDKCPFESVHRNAEYEFNHVKLCEDNCPESQRGCVWVCGYTDEDLDKFIDDNLSEVMEFIFKYTEAPK